MTKLQLPRRLGVTAIIVTLLLSSSTYLMGQAPYASAALPHSINVAYVTDFGTGICDPAGPGFGSSIFVNAVNFGGTAPTGCPGPTATYTTGSNGFGTSAGSNLVTFTNLPVSAIDVGGLPVLTPFDTVLLYEVCDFSSHPAMIAALNSYLSVGGDHKLVILDGDRCAPPVGGFGAGTADYSAFLFPFLSSNPGPSGFTGSITFTETEGSPAVLTRAIPLGFVGPVGVADAIGDSNTFTSNTGGWCSAQEGTNGLAVTGIQTGYARTGTGGLAIWNGWDNWFTFGPNKINAQMFDNILDQPFNPDSLPCGKPVTGIKLDPLTAFNPVGTKHTVTATVSDSTGAPVAGVTVIFTVLTGPNAGATGTAVTNPSGQATFTYSDTGGAGVDTIQAHFIDSTGGVHNSGIVTKNWGTPVTPKPVGGIIVPVDMTALFLAGVMTNAFWMVPTLGGIAGAAIALFKVRRKV